MSGKWRDLFVSCDESVSVDIPDWMSRAALDIIGEGE